MPYELAKAYVHVIPSFKGIKNELKKGLSGGSSGSSAGLSLGKSLISGLKKAGIAAAVGKLFKEAISQGGEYEQLQGGMQKIFGQNMWSSIKSDADNAYKTMNLSASEYMNNITGIGSTFSQTLGAKEGYTTAKTGMQAIADYCSGTGKSVDELMTKYQMISRSTSSYLSIADQFAGLLPQTTDGFLKQAQASGYLDKSYTKLNQVPVQDYQKALTNMLNDGVDKMGLASNTVNETSKTLTGSLAGMKSSIQNLLTSIATGDDISGPLTALTSTASDFIANNLFPMVVNTVSGLLKALPDLTSTVLSLLSTLIGQISQALPTLIPQLAQTLASIFAQLVNALPDLINQLSAALPIIIQAVNSGLEIIIKSLIDNAPKIMAAIGTIFKQLAQSCTDNLPIILKQIWQGLKNIVQAIKNNWPMFKQAAKETINIIKNTLKSQLSDFFEIGKNIVRGLWNGISGCSQWIRNKISGWVGNVMDFIKDLFGIHSPSTWAENEVGAMLPPGAARGVEKNLGVVDTAMSKMRERMSGGSFEVEAGIKVKSDPFEKTKSALAFDGEGAYQAQMSEDRILRLMVKALTMVKVEMNGDEMGTFVENTVRRAVFN